MSPSADNTPLESVDSDSMELIVSDYSALRLIRWYFSFYGRYTFTAVIGAIMCLLKATVFLWIPKIFSVIIDKDLINSGNLTVEQRTHSLLVHASMLLLVVLGNIACNAVYLWLYPKANWHAIRLLRQKLLVQFHRIQIAFHDKQSAGRIRNKIITDANKIMQFGRIALEPLLVRIVLSIVAITIMIVSEPKLILALTPMVPMIIILRAVFVPKLRTRFRAMREELEGINIDVTEQMDGMRIIRAHGMESHRQRAFRDRLKHYSETGRHTDFLRGLFQSFVWGTMVASQALVYGIGGYFVITGSLTPGQLIFYVAMFSFTMGSLNTVIAQIPMIMDALESMRSIHGLLKYPPKEENEGKPPIPELAGEIDIQHVTLTYPGAETPALDDVSLTIRKGETIALVGSSGSGKSSLASLIMGFYEPDSGKMLIDGQDLIKHDRRTYRKQIGVVTQEVMLFNTSVRDNIAFAKPDARFDEIVHAAEQANAHTFIEELDNGYDTEVGDRGIMLSGGQKQRIAIARALLRDPKILILDEATSALDAESEHLVQDALENLMKDRTTILIAHRLSTVRNAERIIVLEEGRIVEIGTHDELLRRSRSRYKTLVELQLK